MDKINFRNSDLEPEKPNVHLKFERLCTIITVLAVIISKRYISSS